MRRTFLAAIVLVLIASQALRFEQTNPPIDGDVTTSPAVRSALREACYGCHSNETKWPWYTQVAPMSWLAHHDVSDGRRRLNFSKWSDYESDPGTKARKLDEIRKLVRTGEMPPWYYRIVHFGGAWPDAKRDAIAKWADDELAGSPPQP